MANKLTGRSLALVTPSDVSLLPAEGFIYIIGTAGNVKVLTVSDEEVIIPMEVKELIPLRVKKIFSTGTTATEIYLLY